MAKPSTIKSPARHTLWWLAMICTAGFVILFITSTLMPGRSFDLLHVLAVAGGILAYIAIALWIAYGIVCLVQRSKRRNVSA